MTNRLYYCDSYTTEFDSRLIDIRQEKSRTGVILEETLFYPTSGGQLHDIGTLNGIIVTDVVENNDEVVHYIEGKHIGNEVRGSIDWDHRFHFMQQHTGQHILSAILLDDWNAETVSASLGLHHSTIEIKQNELLPNVIRNAEHAANEWILKNVPISVLFPTDKELTKLPLRKKPPKEKKIRIVHIDGLDYIPCGGTHCSRTGEVGIIKITGIEKIRGNTRLIFHCGKNALNDYDCKNSLLQSLIMTLSSDENTLVQKATKLIDENKSLSKALAGMKQDIMLYQARDLYQHGKKFGKSMLVTHIFESGTTTELRLLSQELRKCGSCISLLAYTGDKKGFVFSCSEDISLDFTLLLEDVRKEYQVKGGGGRTMIQGNIPDIINIQDFLNMVINLVQSAITR